MRRSIQSELRMLREIAYVFLHDQDCVLCKQPLLQTTKKYMRFGDRCAPPIKDKVTLHHANGNHNDNSKKNRKWVHDLCHRKYHAKLMKRKGGKFHVTNGSTDEKKNRKELYKKLWNNRLVGVKLPDDWAHVSLKTKVDWLKNNQRKATEDKFGRCKSCGLKDYHGQYCKLVSAKG